MAFMIDNWREGISFGGKGLRKRGSLKERKYRQRALGGLTDNKESNHFKCKKVNTYSNNGRSEQVVYLDTLYFGVFVHQWNEWTSTESLETTSECYCR